MNRDPGRLGIVAGKRDVERAAVHKYPHLGGKRSGATRLRILLGQVRDYTRLLPCRLIKYPVQADCLIRGNGCNRFRCSIGNKNHHESGDD
jgi:hypothetical protein